MNTRKSLYDIKSFYNKGAVLKSSFKGMRYQLERIEVSEGNHVLCATVWPEPFCFEKTDAQKKTSREFSYDEDGLDQAYEWLCEAYESQEAVWLDAMEHPCWD